MKQFGKRMGLCMSAAAAIASAAGLARADESSTQANDEIKALRARLEALEAKQAKEETDHVSAARVDAAVSDVLKDADTRSQLFDPEAFSASYSGGKFVIRAGDFTLHPWLHLQLRDGTNYREDAKRGGTATDLENGFELRRARFGFDGNLNADMTYLFNWATNRGSGRANVTNTAGATIGTVNNGQGGLPVLEEAWGKYHIPGTDFYVKGGQLHDPVTHESIVGSKYEVTPERSLQNDIFMNVDAFVQGVTFIWDPKKDIRFEGGITDGIRSANTNFQDVPNNFIAYDYGIAGRVEYKVFGDWKEYDQFTTLGNKKDLLIVGAGADYSEGGDYSTLTHAFDVQYGLKSGLMFYGSYIGRYTHNSNGIPSGGAVSTSFGGGSPAAGNDTYEPAVLGQVSYLIDQKWEPYLRYEYMHLQGTPTGSNNDVHEISVGVTYWLAGHNAKITGQVMYLPNGIPIADDSSEVLLSNDKNELVLTLQFQLLI